MNGLRTAQSRARRPNLCSQPVLERTGHPLQRHARGPW